MEFQCCDSREKSTVSKRDNCTVSLLWYLCYQEAIRYLESIGSTLRRKTDIFNTVKNIISISSCLETTNILSLWTSIRFSCKIICFHGDRFILLDTRSCLVNHFLVSDSALEEFRYNCESGYFLRILECQQ